MAATTTTTKRKFQPLCLDHDPTAPPSRFALTDDELQTMEPTPMNMTRKCVIAHGRHGDWYVATFRGKQVAVKEFKSVSGNREKILRAAKVFNLLGEHPHPNVVRVEGTYTDFSLCPTLSNSCVVVELGSVNLRDRHVKLGSLQLEHYLKVAFEVARGLGHLS